MSQRRLKRQLHLGQVVMLGTAGAIGAEIFVLTGHAAGMVGPAVVLALLIGGILSYSVALNYCELATAYPVTGGAMSYVREAYGTGLLSYLVGAMDCLSSTFYAALSAVGFAYSLQLLIPGLPLVPTAVTIVLLFVGLNLFGVTNVGNVQIVLGAILLASFGIYVAAGFLRPSGFSWETFTAGKTVLAGRSAWEGMSRILATTALMYTSYVGFEVIADDAEEVSHPSRNIPRGILMSLSITLLICVTVSLVTLGVVPWQELAGSETPLTDAAGRFIPGWGVLLMIVAGMIATLTTINSAMLSATREAFTLGRHGVWPVAFAKLNRFRTPWVAILIIGGVSALIAAIGAVDFLSYISSSGYLFVLFWGSLSMIRLRKIYPNLERPFKVPLFPFTAYAAGASCVLIIAFADIRALGFGAAVLALFTALYFIAPAVTRTVGHRLKSIQPEQDRIVIAVANPRTAKSLVHVASIIAQASIDTYICVLTITPPTATRGDEAAGVEGEGRTSPHLPIAPPRLRSAMSPQQRALLHQTVAQARERNVALYTKTRSAGITSEGILVELTRHSNVGLLLLGWPGPLQPEQLAENPVKQVLQKAPTNVAVLLNRGLLLQPLRRILVPVGGGPHSRLALRLAHELADAEGAQVTALRVVEAPASPNGTSREPDASEALEDQTNWLDEIISEALGSVPSNFTLQACRAGSIQEGVLREAAQCPYNLIVMGASEEWASRTRLFGAVDDWVADRSPCSVLLCRRHERKGIAWLRRQVKQIGQEFEHTPP